MRCSDLLDIAERAEKVSRKQMMSALKGLSRVRSRPAVSKNVESTLTKKALSCPSDHGKMILRDG